MMTKNKITFNFKHGNVDGVFVRANSDNTPLVIISNGHNGFYNYGMFPYIQEELAKKEISSYSYNFSHGGVVGDSDSFERLDLYEKNCMKLETEDLCEIVRNISNTDLKYNNKLFLLSHSLGSIPTIFGAAKLLGEGYKIDGIILVAPTKTLDFWSPEQMKEWEENGVLMLRNNRTNQNLPQGKEFLEETKQANTVWNLENVMKSVNAKFIIIHGEKDEAIPIEEAKAINDWNINNKNPTELIAIPEATHTFNTKHPFAGTSFQLDSMIDEIVKWVKKN